MTPGLRLRRSAIAFGSTFNKSPSERARSRSSWWTKVARRTNTIDETVRDIQDEEQRHEPERQPVLWARADERREHDERDEQGEPPRRVADAVEHECAERAQERPEHDGARRHEAAQRELEQDREQQDEEQLERAEGAERAGAREKQDADRRDDAVPEGDRARDRLAEGDVDEPPDRARRQDRHRARDQVPLLAADIIAIAGVRAESADPVQRTDEHWHAGIVADATTGGNFRGVWIHPVPSGPLTYT